MEAGTSGVTGPSMGLCKSVSLVCAAGYQKHFLGLHDGLDTHGVCLTGNVLLFLEETFVGVDGAGGQIYAVSLLREMVAGLVETDMAVASKPQR